MWPGGLQSHRLSLTVNGTPASGSDSPALRRRSTSRAIASGTSGSKSANALSIGSSKATRLHIASASSSADSSRALTRPASARAEAL